MLEALWTVEFVSDNRNYGTGVIVFDTGRIWGGDASYYYIGTGRADNSGIVQAEIQVTHYNGPPSSIFGPLEKFTVRLKGKVEAPVMLLQGVLEEAPERKIAIRCTRRAELP